MIAVNSLDTYLFPNERHQLFPKFGRLYPEGQAMLAKTKNYEQIRHVADYFSVSERTSGVNNRVWQLMATSLTARVLSTPPEGGGCLPPFEDTPGYTVLNTLPAPPVTVRHVVPQHEIIS